MNKWRLQEGEAAERQREVPRENVPSPDKVRTDRKKCCYLGQSSSQNRTQSSPLFRVGNGKSFNNFHHFSFPFFLLPPSKPSTTWKHVKQIKQYANIHVDKKSSSGWEVMHTLRLHSPAQWCQHFHGIRAISFGLKCLGRSSEYKEQHIILRGLSGKNSVCFAKTGDFSELISERISLWENH